MNSWESRDRVPFVRSCLHTRLLVATTPSEHLKSSFIGITNINFSSSVLNVTGCRTSMITYSPWSKYYGPKVNAVIKL